jgi:dATP/dGTP diphosphohydrolase
LKRQMKWSENVAGPGERTKGLIEHIRKELQEIELNPQDLEEWIDVVMLALDGAWRLGYTPNEIVTALAMKQAKNEARKWPDWRTHDPNKAFEHECSITDRPSPPPPTDAQNTRAACGPSPALADKPAGDAAEYSNKAVAALVASPGAQHPCTCHPDDNPPVPCPRRYAYGECVEAALTQAVVDAAIIVIDRYDHPETFEAEDYRRSVSNLRAAVDALLRHRERESGT